MASGDFYAADPLEQVAINLFYGWGYNFYRVENQLRADDLLVRAKAGGLLGDARALVDAAEAAYRRSSIAAPTRAKPFPDPQVLANARALERLAGEIGALEGQVRSQPVPENDRMSEFYRGERETLLRLGEHDRRLVGQAELMRAKLAAAGDAAAILSALPEVEEGVRALAETLRLRRAVLEG